jgi:hypothetical protein
VVCAEDGESAELGYPRVQLRLNRVFELNRLPYGGYPGDDAAAAADRRGKKQVVVVEEGPSREAAPSTKKRKIGTTVGGWGSLSVLLWS